MADNRNIIGKFTDEMEQTTGEVVQDVKDSAGEAIEQGVQSGPTPQQIQQKQTQDQKDMVEARRKIAFYNKTDQEQKIVRQQEKQKLTQKQQIEAQEKQAKKAKEAAQKQSIP
ncbi:hypothetical protein KKE03_03245, partial [Patescibacteria group bacterium]|nr:hypothetical protein [Patescibacteria group bacterium]